MYSGIPQVFLNFMPAVTYEGDNTVMAMQPTKTLLGALKALTAGRTVVGNFGFLVDSQPLPTDFSSDEFGTALFGRITAALARSLQSKMNKLAAAGVKPKAIEHSLTQQDSFLLGKAYCFYFTHRSFADTVRSVTDPATSRLLTLLRQVYIVAGAVEFGSEILRQGVLSAEAFKAVRGLMPELLKELRPSLQLLVNGFDFSDTFLCSALGRQDGKVYETLLELARGNPVNETQPHPAILKHVKPLVRL